MIESTAIQDMYEKFIEEFTPLARKYISNLMQIEDIKASDFITFIYLSSIGLSCFLFVSLEERVNMSFDDIMNKFIPQCSEKSIKIIKEIKELKNFTNL
jgi:hypothetical protein